MTVGTLALYIYELSLGVGELKATSIAFTVFVMFQIFNVFNCRSEKGFSNKFLLIAIGISLYTAIMRYLYSILPGNL